MKKNGKYIEKVLTNKRTDGIIKSIQRKSEINKKDFLTRKGILKTLYRIFHKLEVLL